MTEIRNIDNIEHKLCSKCKSFKPLSEFQKRQDSKDGFRDQCIDCLAEMRQKRAKPPANITQKMCSKCKNLLSIGNFNRSSSSPDGYAYTCKSCNKQFAELNKEQIQKRNKEYNSREDVKQRQKVYHILYKIDPKIASESLDYYLKHEDKLQDIHSKYLETTKSAIAKKEKEAKHKQILEDKQKQEQKRIELYNKGYKTCSICKKEVKLSDFNKRLKSVDGLDNACRFCRVKRTKELYEQRGQANLQEKVCSCCGKLLPISNFYFCRSTTDGYQGQCKNCESEKAAVRKQNMTEEQKRQRMQYLVEYNAKNRDRIKDYQKQHRKQNKEKLQQMEKQRYMNNRLNKLMSTMIYHSLRENKAERHWEDLVPYNLQQLKEHLESQFTPEMNWDNQGSYWEIDHIIPQNLFNFETENDIDFKICWSLMNLRPLEKAENRRRPKDGSDISQETKDSIISQIVI